MSDAIFLSLLIFAAAVLYSSVGHGGASGYLAAMALFGVAPDVMKPAALVLNLFVAGLGAVRYARAGCFSWNTFWPFAVTSVPLAAVGGSLQLPGQAYRNLLAAVLVFAAWRLAFNPSSHAPAAQRPVVLSQALGWGGIIGLLSGLTGVGGGIFLSPLLLLLGWAEIRKTAGISAMFILVNSAAGLLGHWRFAHGLPRPIVWWIPIVVAGGLIGSELGTRRLTPLFMRRLLAAVLVVAGLKLFFTR